MIDNPKSTSINQAKDIDNAISCRLWVQEIPTGYWHVWGINTRSSDLFCGLPSSCMARHCSEWSIGISPTCRRPYQDQWSDSFTYRENLPLLLHSVAIDLSRRCRMSKAINRSHAVTCMESGNGEHSGECTEPKTRLSFGSDSSCPYGVLYVAIVKELCSLMSTDLILALACAPMIQACSHGHFWINPRTSWRRGCRICGSRWRPGVSIGQFLVAVQTTLLPAPRFRCNVFNNT